MLPEQRSSPGRRDVDDARRDVDVVADEVLTAPRRSAPVEPGAHPERHLVGVGGDLEPDEDRDARAHRRVGVGEEDEQAVAELLHDARAVGQRRADDAVLGPEHRERFAVAPGRGELGEPDEIGERDRAFDCCPVPVTRRGSGRRR